MNKTFLAYSLGCRTNQAEIETICSRLTLIGFTSPLKKNKPDLVLLNSCVVTQKAEKETKKEIRKLRRIYPQSYLVVLGCLASKENKSKAKSFNADLLINNQEKEKAHEIIEQKFCSNSKNKKSDYFLNNKYVQSGRKLIKIQDGCNCYCSFCITKLLRGKPKSVLKEEIVKEINYWVSRGVKEITLTGINIALYGLDFETNIVFLIKDILKKTKIERISFSSIYPEMLSKDFLKLVIKNKRIVRCFHLSLQSGSTTVLKRMNRNTNLIKLKGSVEYLRKKIPDFTLRADFITGFPQESKSEFMETIKLVEDLKISFAHVFSFSKRVNTLAYQNIKSGQWEDFPEKLKKERVEKLTTAVKKVFNDEAIKQYGRVCQCLIIRTIPSLNSYEGITQNNWPVSIKKTKLRIEKIKGKILPVKITGHNDYLLGEIVSLPI